MSARTGIAGALCLLGVGLWSINVIVAADRILDLHWLDPEILAKIPSLVQVDISTVTTLVVAMTLFHVTLGSYRLDHLADDSPSNASIRHADFPFAPGFGSLLIQLGLLGTIFAFIIAFSDLSEASRGGREAYDPTVLITPLGTALWSTFSGIFCAFVVLPVVSRVFRAWAGRAAEDLDAEAGVEAVGQAFDRLGERVDGVGGRLDRLQARVGGLVEQLEILDRHSLGDWLETGLELGRQMESTSASLQATSQHLDSTLRDTSRQLAKAPRALAEVIVAIDSLGGELSRQHASSQALASALAGVDGALVDNTVNADRLAAELQVSQRSASDLGKHLGLVGEGLGDLASAVEVGEHERSQLRTLREHLRDLERRLARPARFDLVARLWRRTFGGRAGGGSAP